MTLSALVRSARDGEHNALERLLGLIQDPVYRYLVARLRLYQEAEDLARDLAQEALIRIANAIGRCTFDSDSRVLAWVLTVARNVLLDHIRSERSRSERMRFTSDLERAGGQVAWAEWQRQTDDVEPGVASRILLRVVEEARASLPEATVELLRLRVDMGATWKEVGAALGTTEAGAKRRFQRAQATLRVNIGQRLQALPDGEKAAVEDRVRRFGLPTGLALDRPPQAGRARRAQPPQGRRKSPPEGADDGSKEGEPAPPIRLAC